MKLFFSLLFSISLFSVGFSTVLMASRPAIKTVFYLKSTISDSVSTTKQEIIFLNDSIQTKIEELPEKPKKNGLGMIIWGILFTFLGTIFGVALLLTFLLGFSIGSAFYFRDIYTIAGIMLTGLITFGVGIYMISRGTERWRAYRRYKRAIKKIKKAQ